LFLSQSLWTASLLTDGDNLQHARWQRPLQRNGFFFRGGKPNIDFFRCRQDMRLALVNDGPVPIWLDTEI
jgi:hypothetical protein